jgi:hypothetical protein
MQKRSLVIQISKIKKYILTFQAFLLSLKFSTSTNWNHPPWIPNANSTKQVSNSGKNAPRIAQGYLQHHFCTIFFLIIQFVQFKSII